MPRLRIWLAVVVAVGVIEALYGTYQVVGSHPHIYWLRKTAYLDSATGTFVYRGNLAGYFEMVIPIAIALALGQIPWHRSKHRAPSGRRRRTRPRRSAAAHTRRFVGTGSVRGMLLMAATGMMLVAMGLTQSRGGVLSCLGGLALGALLFGAWRRQLTPARVLIGAALLSSLALVWLQSPQLLQRFGSELRLTPYSRPSLWRETLKMALDFPLLGVGLGDFEFVFPRYQPEGTTTYINMAHNDYLQLFAETGVLGVACFAWLFLRLFGLLRRQLHACEPECGVMVLGLMAGAAALLLHSFTDFNLHIPANALLFVVGLGATVRLLDQNGRLGLQGRIVLRSRALGVGAIAAGALAAVLVARNWWVENLVRSIFPNTSLVSPMAGPPESIAVRARRVGVALRMAPRQAELAEAVGWLGQRVGRKNMRRRVHLGSEKQAQQTADAWAAAASGYQRLVELRPSVAYGHLRLGQAVSRLAEVRHGFELPGEVTRPVVAIFDRALHLQPRDRLLTREISEWALAHWPLLAEDDRSRAVQWTQVALGLDPLRGRELLRIALIWDSNLPERLVPDDLEARFYMALAYKDAGRVEEAARVAAALDEELDIRVRSIAAEATDARLLGRVRELRGEPGGAAKAYERAGTLSMTDTDRAEAFKRGGYNWLGAGDLDKAYRALTAARRYGDRDPEVLAGLSAVHERRGDFAAAARFVRSALAAAQGAPEYRYRLARLYDRAHEYGNANEQYRRLLDEAPPEFLSRHRTDILLSLARNYRQLEIGSEARRFYSLVLERDSHNREAREFLSYFGW